MVGLYLDRTYVEESESSAIYICETDPPAANTKSIPQPYAPDGSPVIDLEVQSDTLYIPAIMMEFTAVFSKTVPLSHIQLLLLHRFCPVLSSAYLISVPDMTKTFDMDSSSRNLMNLSPTPLMPHYTDLSGDVTDMLGLDSLVSEIPEAFSAIWSSISWSQLAIGRLDQGWSAQSCGR